MNDSRFKRGIVGMVRRALRVEALREPVRSLSRNGLLPERVWQRLPHDFEFQFSGPSATKFIYVADQADDMARRLLWRGWSSWEPETTPLWCSLARDASFAIDIGAYTGYFSLLALSANPDLELHAFEPMEGQRIALERNLERNDWLERAVVLPYAAGSSRRSAMMYGSRRMSLTAAFQPSACNGVQIDVVTLDEHLKNRAVDLIKIDVEGAEAEVLHGARTTLERDQPLIVCEILSSTAAREVDAVLRSLRYLAFEIAAGGLRQVWLSDFSPDPRFRNVLLAPVHREPEMRVRLRQAGMTRRRSGRVARH